MASWRIWRALDINAANGESFMPGFGFIMCNTWATRVAPMLNALLPKQEFNLGQLLWLSWLLLRIRERLRESFFGCWALAPKMGAQKSDGTAPPTVGVSEESTSKAKALWTPKDPAQSSLGPRLRTSWFGLRTSAIGILFGALRPS